METKQQNAHATNEPHRIEKLYIENTLLRISGALFCHDRKRASSHTEEIKLHSSASEKTIAIRPDPKLGQPGQLAHKIFIALNDYFRRKAAKEIFDALADHDKAVIDGLAQTYAASFGGLLRSTMAEVGRIRFTIERYGARLMTFEQWQNESTSLAPCGL